MQVPKSATFGIKNRLAPFRTRTKIQSACYATTCDDPSSENAPFQNSKTAPRRLPHRRLGRSPLAPRPPPKPTSSSKAARSSTAPAANPTKATSPSAMATSPPSATMPTPPPPSKRSTAKASSSAPASSISTTTATRRSSTNSGRSARCYLTQGCTTLVTGNCGGGPTDIAKFYDDLDAKGTGINIATLVPQGSVREKVMGKRAPRTDARRTQANAGPRRRRHAARRLGHLDRPAVHPQRVRQDRRADRHLQSRRQAQRLLRQPHPRRRRHTHRIHRRGDRDRQGRTPAGPRLPSQVQQEAQLGQGPRRRPSHREGPARRHQDHRRPVSVHRLLHFDHGHAPPRRRTRRRRASHGQTPERRSNRKAPPPHHRQRHRSPRPDP